MDDMAARTLLKKNLGLTPICAGPETVRESFSLPPLTQRYLLESLSCAHTCPVSAPTKLMVKTVSENMLENVEENESVLLVLYQLCNMTLTMHSAATFDNECSCCFLDTS